MSDELKKLREQKRRLEAQRARSAADFFDEVEAIMLRKKIRELGEVPCA